MATEKPKPFLTAIKDEVDGFFAETYDQLEPLTDNCPAMAEVLQITRKKVWKLMEEKLKESFRNGQSAKTNGRARAEVATDPEARPNPFRK